MMEFSTMRSLAEMGMMDQSFLHQWQMNPFDDFNSVSTFCDNYNDTQLFSHPIFVQEKRSLDFSENDTNRPLKQQKTSSWGSSNQDHSSNTTMSSASPNFNVVNSHYPSNPSPEFPPLKPKVELDFSSVTMNFPQDIPMVSPTSVIGHQNYVFKSSPATKRVSTSSRLPHQANDHILAERKRREKLSQRFIALSKLVPGLKKMDKASVLGDAIKYLKQLQGRVEKLEEQTKKQTVETVVFVKKHEIHSDGDHNSSSSDENFSSEITTKPLPEIEARFSGKDVLIRIHCEKRKRILDKIVGEVEKFHLSVVNNSALTFGNSALDITITAQMDEEFNMSIKDFVKNLRGGLQRFMGKEH